MSYLQDVFFITGMSGGGGSGVAFHLVNRTSWGARVPTATTPYPHPPANYVVIIHTESIPCDSESVCSSVVRDIQHEHMDRRNFSDIGYNFLVGGDGQIYEGRGWDSQGAFAKGFNDKSLGVAFIGTGLNFNVET
jgi:N-acetylmuramoyl-L-alanine amidase